MHKSTRLLLSAAAIGLGLPALAQAQMGELPDGEGKNLVQGLCVACHETNLITGSVGYNQDDWAYLVSGMINLAEPIQSQVTGYLAEHFPPSGARQPTLVAGDEVIEIREWRADVLGQRPRDTFMHTDGTIWWAGMYGSVVGMLDPATGEQTTYRLDPTARPHSVIEGPDGDVYYSGNSNNTIGRIDRETGEIRVYPTGNPDIRDPHTMAFAQDGSLWFTAQNSNYYGRLDPETGEFYTAQPPTEGARPYGIRRDSQGMMWIAYRGAFKIARVNPETREVTEFETPNYGMANAKNYYVRRLAIDSQDNVWYVDSAMGEIGRFNPKTGEFKQWPSPSGPDSHPYAIHVVNDKVWYNESRQRPDTLVRFDPETESFQSWAIPSGIGVIRNMDGTADGNLVIAQSMTNTVGIVLIGEENIAKYSDILVSQN